MTKDEALKLALEALEEYVNVVVSVNDPNEWTPKVADAGEPARKAITAIKEALAQTEQEPVTWRYKIVDVFGRPAWTLKTPKSDTRVLESQPLYTTPPQRTWVGLTDEEREEIALEVPMDAVLITEAKLKEKNT